MINIKEIFIYGIIISMGCEVININGFLKSFVREVFVVFLVIFIFYYTCLSIVVNLFQNKIIYGLSIGALLFNFINRVSEGWKITGLCRLSSIVLGDFSVGSILDPMGFYNLTFSRVDAYYFWLIEAPSPSIIDRQSIFEPLQTGIFNN